MEEKVFSIGDLVWAKMGGYPPWPAQIILPIEPPPEKQFCHHVYFFGSKNHAWILGKNITHHSESLLEKAKKSKKMTQAFRRALAEIAEVPVEVEMEIEDASELEPSDISVREPNIDPPLTVCMHKEEPSLKVRNEILRSKYKKLRNLHSKSSTSSAKASSWLKNKIALKKNPSPRTVIRVPPPSENIVSLGESSSPFVASSCSSASSSLAEDGFWPLESTKEPKTYLQPTPKKIGVLGLGMMGVRLVANLLKSGHDVTVWNRTTEKYERLGGRNFLLEKGASIAKTAAEVIVKCDIIFSCVYDAQASKNLLNMENGVMKGLEKCQGQKGYVEMTNMDKMTSQIIRECVNENGGIYLEAPIIGTYELAEKGELTILGAGNKDLFEACTTVFHAISKNAYFISEEVGSALSYSVLCSTVVGATSAILGEAMGLAKKLFLDRQDVLQMLNLLGFTSPLFIEEPEVSQTNNFPALIPIKLQQKDMHLALELSNSSDHPMTVTSAANEVFINVKQRERKLKEEKEREQKLEEEMVREQKLKEKEQEQKLKEKEQEQKLKEEKEREQKLKEEKEREQKLKEEKEREQRLKDEKEREQKLKDEKEREQKLKEKEREQKLKEEKQRELELIYPGLFL